jgi:hypothetical protein
MIEEEFLIAEDETVLVVENDREADPFAVEEGTVAAAEVYQRETAGIFSLDERVEAGYRPAVQQDRASIAAADRPRLSFTERIAASAGRRAQERPK